MLDDVLVERFSRQILLPEVGGRGQERLCTASVTVTGGDTAAHVAASLLAAAGPRVALIAADAGSLQIAASEAVGVRTRHHASGGVVATLAGRPCMRCAPDLTAPEATGSRDAGVALQTIGALAAGETLALLLGIASSRVQSVDLARGVFRTRALAGARACPACGARG